MAVAAALRRAFLYSQTPLRLDCKSAASGEPLQIIRLKQIAWFTRLVGAAEAELLSVSPRKYKANRLPCISIFQLSSSLSENHTCSELIDLSFYVQRDTK